jgi:class 3 adenylate cyclase/tetratricopeptide (TPR) repeat protein
MTVARKTVTVLFADVADSTGLGERFDPESVRGALARWFDVARVVIERHGGTVEKFIGDAVMAVFGVPQLHEDDAVRAVFAADELRRRGAALSEELERERGVRLVVRVGLNTGEVVTGDGETTLVTGDAVNIAKRLEEAAGPGEVVLGEATRRLVGESASLEPLAPVVAKGKTQPVNAWRLVEVDRDASPFARRFDTPLVGRVRELGHLQRAYARSLAERTCYLYTLLGPAGIGKSRLACEFFDSVADEAEVLTGRCLPYGDGITFWPLAQVLRDAGGDDAIKRLLAGTEDRDLVVERLSGIKGRANIGSQETFWAVRKVCEALAQQQPLVLCFEDIHWAEPTFLDLIQYLAGWVRDAPVMLVCIARPEFLNERPSWLSGQQNAASLTLMPLPLSDADALLDALGIDAEGRERIAEAAEGNPLYLEQMAAMVAEGGYSEGMFSIPPTIQALLAARLDRLDSNERAAIERAAVCGKEFWLDAIKDLTPEAEHARIGATLLSLARKELIRPHRSSSRPDDAFAFAHVLIRDAAYAAVPKETRAILHGQFADWVAENESERAAELAEIVGYHLEQSFRYREELNLVDADARRLATRAGELLGDAGHRAFARGDMPAAVNLLARSAALLDDDHPLRVQGLPELGSALMRTGDFTRADEVLSEALARAAAAGDKRLELRTLIEREFFRTFTEPETPTEDLVRVADQAIPLLEELGDELGLAKAWWLRSEADVIAGRWGARAEALERALTHARRVPDSREGSTIVAHLAQALEYGPTPVRDAIRRCEELRAEFEGDPAVEAAIASTLAGLNAMQGRFDEARSLYADAAALYDELGLRYLRAARTLVAGMVELLAGDADAAVRELRWGYDVLEEMGERGVRSTISAFLAQALVAQGSHDEAVRFSEISDETGAPADVVTQAVWRAARGQALANLGELKRAEPLAREAVALTDGTDFLDLQASTLASLADVLRLAGQPAEAGRLLTQARETYTRKGNVVAAERLGAPAEAR